MPTPRGIAIGSRPVRTSRRHSDHRELREHGGTFLWRKKRRVVIDNFLPDTGDAASVEPTLPVLHREMLHHTQSKPDRIEAQWFDRGRLRLAGSRSRDLPCAATLEARPALDVRERPEASRACTLGALDHVCGSGLHGRLSFGAGRPAPSMPRARPLAGYGLCGRSVGQAASTSPALSASTHSLRERRRGGTRRRCERTPRCPARSHRESWR